MFGTPNIFLEAIAFFPVAGIRSPGNVLQVLELTDGPYTVELHQKLFFHEALC
jgi:hypothetical protein